MVVHFRARGISRDARKLARTRTLNLKIKNKENKIGRDSLSTSGVNTSQVTMRASQTGHVTCDFFFRL